MRPPDPAQPSLWDAAPIAPAVPSGVPGKRLRWGKWPAKDAPLVVDGDDEEGSVWVFVAPWPCGSERSGVLLRRWDERDDPWASCRGVYVECVRELVVKDGEG